MAVRKNTNKAGIKRDLNKSKTKSNVSGCSVKKKTKNLPTDRQLVTAVDDIGGKAEVRPVVSGVGVGQSQGLTANFERMRVVKMDAKKLVAYFKEIGIKISFFEDERKVTIDKYVLYYCSKESVTQTLEEVFINLAYLFHSNLEMPFIVDAGSEVGVATLFFKIFYPKAKILCFEAHPDTFKLLQKNIKVNKFTDVEAFNVALADRDGTISFYGEFGSIDDDLDSRGNSIIKSWGLQRATSSEIKVTSVKLSNYLDQPVDYLKLNVEGAEQQILDDLEKNKKLLLIRRSLIKFHASKATEKVNSLARVNEILEKGKLKVINELRKIPAAIFPDVTEGWVNQNLAGLRTIYAAREGYGLFETLGTVCPGDFRTRLLLGKTRFLEGKKQSLEMDFALAKSVLDNLPASVYWKDMSGAYLGHGAYAIGKLRDTDIVPGATKGIVIGKTDYDLFPLEVADRYRANDQYVIDNRKDLLVEETIFTPDGKELTQLSAKKPLYNQDGEVVGVIGSTIDITDRKNVERLKLENEAQRKTITEQERFKKVTDQLVHDIRSPLSSLLMITKSCSKEVPEQTRLALREVVNSINDLANNLLAKYSNYYEADDARQPILVVLMLQQILSEKRYQYKYLPVEFVTDFPSPTHFILIKLDKADFKRMMSNLINNAVESLDKGKGKITIGVKIHDGNRVEIFIMDNGKGMSAELTDKIKNNIQVTSGKEGGYGLGFSQVREALDNNQGNLIIESKLGSGTKISTFFPTAEAPAWMIKEIELFSGDTVVVLDDDDSVHNAWKMRFNECLDEIVLKHFYTGVDVVEFIYNFPDKEKLVLLTDYELLKQGMNGIQIIERSNLSRTILVTSHYANPIVRDLAIKCRSKILPKPIAAEIPIILANRMKSLDRKLLTRGSLEKKSDQAIKIVAIDDNKIFLNTMAGFIENLGKVVNQYHDPFNFLEELSEYSQDTIILIDNDFGVEISGVQLAEKLHAFGYKKLYLLTGSNAEQVKAPSYLTVIQKTDIDSIKRLCNSG